MALETKEKNEILQLVFNELVNIFEDENVLSSHSESEEIQNLRETVRKQLKKRIHTLKIEDDLARGT